MPNHVIEVAVFEARAPDRFPSQQAELHRALTTFDGYVDSLGLRGLDEPSVFADLVLWRDLDTALAAAEVIGTRPDFAWFHDTLGEIRLFAHVHAFEEPRNVLAASAAAPVVEIVAYRPADPEAQRVAHRLLHSRHLAAVDGVVAHTGFLGDDGLVGDLIGWVDVAAHERTGATLMPVAELSPIFDSANDVVVFGLFGRSGA